MSNRNRKAKGTTMVDKKLAKANQKIAELSQQLQAANMSLMNMRQMYEGAVTEKNGFRAAAQRANQIVTAILIQSRGNSKTIKESTFKKLGDYVGYDVEEEDGSLRVFTVTKEEFEDMGFELPDEEEADDEGE